MRADSDELVCRSTSGIPFDSLREILSHELLKFIQDLGEGGLPFFVN